MKVTTPVLVPLAPDVIVIQDEFGAAVHPHPAEFRRGELLTWLVVDGRPSP